MSIVLCPCPDGGRGLCSAAFLRRGGGCCGEPEWKQAVPEGLQLREETALEQEEVWGGAVTDWLQPPSPPLLSLSGRGVGSEGGREVRLEQMV